MQRREMLFLILLAAPVCADKRQKHGKKSDQKQCAAINRRIKRLESRQRLAHSAKQGRAMKQQTRELQLKRYRLCR